MEERYSEAGRGDGRRFAISPNVPAIPVPADEFTPTPKGDLYRNFGDGYTRAWELAITPTIFGGLGYLLDRWLGIVPVLTIVFALAALVTLMTRTWAGYVRRMETLEAAGPWANRAKPMQEGTS